MAGGRLEPAATQPPGPARLLFGERVVVGSTGPTWAGRRRLARSLTVAGMVATSLALVPAGPAGAAVTACPAPTVVSGTNTVLCTFTGDAQTWTVSAGVTSATFDLSGAGGGAGGGAGLVVLTPGPGGRASATLVVEPGQVYQVMVGGQGEDAGGEGHGGTGLGGFNGGGSSPGGIHGGGGGGASDVRLDGSCALTGACSSDDRLIVAGGGGGAGVPVYSSVGDGGAGGGVSGGDGTSATGGGRGGGGGGPTMGGAGAPASPTGQGQTAPAAGSGGLGQGGDGSEFGPGTGGGGGGGLYGRGAGGGAVVFGGGSGGGGGGSGFVPAGGSLSSGTNLEDGSVSITYTVEAASASVSVADAAALSEGNGGVNTPKLATFDVTRTGDLSGPATVRFHTESGTSGARAIEERDFKARDTLVQFPAGVATVPVTVKIVGDRDREPTERFRAVLSDSTGGLDIARNVALGTIVDDD